MRISAVSQTERPRRVLLITARADNGGGPRHILDLLQAMKGSGVEFSIASPNQAPYAERFRPLTRSFVEIPARRFSLRSFLALAKFAKINEIDVIHSHGRGAGLYSRLLGLALRTQMKRAPRVIHTFHGIHREKSVMGRVKLWLDRILALTPFTAVFVSQNEKREAFEYGCAIEGRECHVVDNAVDLSRFIGRDRLAFDEEAQKSGLRFGAFLRADPAKGPDRFLRLVRELRSTDLGKSFWKCAGVTRDELKAFGEIPAWLECSGLLKEPADWLQSLDVFVSTARNEGLPLGVLEAMAAGCFCILSDIPAHRDFKVAKAALLFDPSDPTSFVNEVSYLRNDSALRETLQRNARQLIRSRHSLDVFREKLERVYQGDR